MTVTQNKQDFLTKEPISLNSKNYYTKEASWSYLSKSLYHEFERCEAETLARLKNEYEPDTSLTPLLVGNYVHSYFESPESHEKFVQEHSSEILSSRGKTKGKLKADYQQADKMIKCLEDEKLFRNVYMTGKKEVIVTGQVNGVWWKGKIDSLNLKDGYFCDLKTTTDIHKKVWNSDFKQYQNFVEAYGYYTQIALYKELIKQTFNVDCVPFIFAVSKEKTPDKMAIKFTSPDDVNALEYYFNRLKDDQDHMVRVLAGEEKPKFCGKCDYCKSVKHLDDFVNASEIEVV
ncbi:PD-(D/E)XK nuclease-like domain-containing protein [Liquorilactobacillus satsumensis]|nr:PD-(D/E)XK nuclease-like domain-containing protein [Liquorilactobacillus satsumensis]MCP9371789.1 PD-(D/E)XK nuclease-like domain-containing protein [Liquorilactobacillus satsumensis]